MKKTLFSVLRTMCVGAMTLFAVSCYDDSALWGEVDRLDDRIDSLAAALNSQVEAINSKIGAVEDAYKAADADILAKLQAGDAELAASLTALTTKLDEVDGKVDGYIESNDAALKAAAEQYQKALKDLEGKLTDADKALAEADADLLVKLAGVGIVKVEKKNGNAVLTFTDGTTLEVGAYDANANNEGLVTVVEDEDGTKYWAVVLADGTKKNLEVAVGHHDLQFQVSDSEELEYSVDGGATWTGTGAYVSTSQQVKIDFYQGEGMNYDTWEYEYDDFYTLVFGEETYYLPLYKVDNSVVTIKAGKTYFEYGESKTFEIAISDITSMYLMTKPDGWKAKLDDEVLTVAAPAEAAVTAGTADADGEVLLHCTTVEGKCKIAKLNVATTSGFNLTVVEDSVFIVNPEVVTSVNPMMGWETTDFNDAYIGLAPVAAFEADPAAYVAGCQNNYDDIIFMLSGWKQNTMDWETGEFTLGGTYEEGVYEVDVINTTVGDIYKYMTYSEVPDGSRFVVWACPVDDKGMPVTDKLVFGYYSSPVVAKIEAVEGGVSVSDVEVAVTVSGAESYYVGIVAEQYMYGHPVDDYMQNQEGPFGYFQMALQYGMPDYAFQYMGTLFGGESGMEMPETIKASDLMGGALMPEMKVYMWVFPVIADMPLEDYTYADNLKPYIYEFTTNALQAGGSATVEFGDAEIEYTSMAVNLEATAGSTMIYYAFYAPEDFDALADGVADDLLENGYVLAGDEGVARKTSGVKPGTELILAALAIDADGKYGVVNNETFTSPTITFSETFKATVGEPVFEANGANWKVTMPVAVEGGKAAKYFYYWNASARTEEQLNNLPLGSDGYYYYYEATTIPALWFYSSNTTMQFAVVVVSETGELSKPAIVTVNKPAAE